MLDFDDNPNIDSNNNNNNKINDDDDTDDASLLRSVYLTLALVSRLHV